MTHNPTAASTSAMLLWTGRLLETLWLLTVVLVPVAFLGRTYGEWSSIVGSFELPKIVVLRALVGLMAGLWLLEWAIKGRPSPGIFSRATGWRPGAWRVRLGSWLSGRPTRWVTLAVALYLTSTLLSTALSASFATSLWGDVPGQDSYGAFTVVAYVLLFGVILTHLRTPSQLWRLLGAIVVAGVLVGGYGVAQHYGQDPFDLMEPPNTRRVSSTMGNATFAAAVMVMTIPVSLAAATVALQRPLRAVSSWGKLGLWSLVLAVQLLGIAFTLSRGPWGGVAVALAGFLGLTAAFAGWRSLVRASLSLGVAAAITAAILFSPLPKADEQAPVSTTASLVADRLAAVGPHQVSGGLTGRLQVWEGSWRLMRDRPWFEFDTLSLPPLRPLVGYGPDVFRYAYLLESPPGSERLPSFEMLPSEPDHAHNYLVHQGVELGLSGLFASLGVFLTASAGGLYLLLRPMRDSPTALKLALAAGVATLAGRFIEQMVGVARVSDLTIFWVLLAVLAALPAMLGQTSAKLVQDERPSVGSAPGRRRRGPSLGWGSGLRDWHVIWRVAVAGGLITGIGLLVWLRNVDYLRAALIADRGAAQLRAGDVQAAMASLDRAIDLAPDVSSYYGQRAVIYWALRGNGSTPPRLGCSLQLEAVPAETCLAEEAYARNLAWTEQRPFDYRSRLSLADSARELGLLKENELLVAEALRLYREAAEMVPNSWPLWNRLAEVEIEGGRPEAALRALETSLSITGDSEQSGQALRLQAEAYREWGLTQMAIATLDELIQREPNNKVAYFLRGSLYDDAKQHQSALADLDRAIELDSQYAEAYFRRGTVHYSLGSYRRALQDFNLAIHFRPLLTIAYNDRGLAYASLGELALAIQDFDEAIRLDPSLAVAYNNRGFAYRALDKPQKAIEDLDQAILLDPGFAMAFYNRALAHVLLGDASAAQRDAARAVELGLDGRTVKEALRTLQESR